MIKMSGIIKKRHRIAVLLAGGLLALSLTGCAENQIPDITDEQMDVLKNQVAAMVMKYNMGHKSRLVDLSKYSDIPTEPDATPDRPQGMDPVDDTPVINPSVPDSPGSSGEATAYRIEEVLGLPEGVTLTFLGYGTYDFYPDEADGADFGISASEGKKLLVLSFSLENIGVQEQEVDLQFPEATFRVTVNGDYTRKALTTILLNDLFTYSDTLEAGGSAETVLVIEVTKDMDGNISSIDLGVEKERKIYRFGLL